MAGLQKEKEVCLRHGNETANANIEGGSVHLPFSLDEERGVVKKIDWFVLPMMCLVFFFQYLDKQSLNYASVFGLIEHLSLQELEYSWCSSLFYLGQLVSEYPFIYLMSRLPLARLVGICMCLAAPHNFAGFAAVRFLLGLSEGAVSPAFVTLTSMWYRKKEHASRVGIWVIMNGLAQILSSLLMYGIGKTLSSHLAPWRVLFLICGALTAGFEVLFHFVVPSNPGTAWFLTQKEREVIVARMALDRDGGDQTDFSIAQVKESIMDMRAWLIFAFGILVTMQSPVLTFASLIIKNLDYDKFQTMLFTSPSGAVQIVAIWIGIFGCILLPNSRCLVVMSLAIPPLIGNILLLKLPLTAGWGLIVSPWLASCISDVMAILLSLSASNIKGNTKRATATALAASLHHNFRNSNTAPRHFEGVITAIVTWYLLVAVMGLYWFLCWKENRRRDEGRHSYAGREYRDGEDITDIQDPLFRYSY
ncbi:pantothenate transporter [Aspergillus ruber CBS 135680]|uniref:Pantothenate transporter n=1 Tax=Aspergillus ruber (strain CBS 135680) TaxID=1388766 RepID=A0A017SS97_ASPRC|nr:pantothenate transporter [Aspergillus ruber CBS 135680]EYE99853.1 pantothenate transporter [Aspergillus ruber CBS 135680]